MTIIFLDFDGVMIPYGGDMRRFHGESAMALRAIVNATGAKIVLSSSWRLGMLPQAMEMLRVEGFELDVIGTTPLHFMGEDMSVSRSRSLEIKKWLNMHPDVKTYVAIDDETLHLDVKAFNTHPREGLRYTHVSQVVRLLNVP